MDRTEQQKSTKTPTISPLVKDKTYGERKYDMVFDNILNYWTNLLASAGFSHWAAHTTSNLPFTNQSPRALQEGLGEKIANSWLLKGYYHKQIMENGALKASEGLANGSVSALRSNRLLKKAVMIAERNLEKRGFAMAESLTLLVPGFAVVLPSVWLGAKIKPWFIETLDKKHYGAEAMDDPTLKARHQAIEAEVRPSLLGTVTARMGTVAAVQLSAKLIGSESNTVNFIGKATKNETLKNFKGINPVASSIGEAIGNAMPKTLQASMSNAAQKMQLSWSNKQKKLWLKKNPRLTVEDMGPYKTATQDLLKFISMDTIYTLVSAGTIHPFLKLLAHVPGMTYTPKRAPTPPTIDGEPIIKPTNPLADVFERTETPPVAEKPGLKISQIDNQSTLAARHQQPQLV